MGVMDGITSVAIWTYIFGGATVFGTVVGVFSVWNGRMTRKELAQTVRETQKETQELISATQKLIAAEGENPRKTIQELKR